MPDFSEIVSLSALTILLQAHSMASIKAWLKSMGVSYSASGRAALAERVHGLLKTEKITEDGLRRALIGIEEAGGKRVFIFRVEDPKKSAGVVKKMLKDLEITLSTVPVPAPQLPSKTTLVYAIDSEAEFRVKWSETHRSYATDVDTLTVTPEKDTKIVVGIFNKQTGLVQLRCDKPETRHPHKLGKTFSAESYFSYFREQMEMFLGEELVAMDLRGPLERLISTVPRLVEMGGNDSLSDEGMTIKILSRKRGRDVRDARDWNAMSKHGARTRSHESESVFWLVEPSNGVLSREVFTFIDGRKGFLRFLADCLETEMEYALEKAV